MSGPASRPSQAIPRELLALMADAQDTLGPVELWLFGSRARGDAKPDSDWDLLAVLPDDASDALVDPLLAWQLRYRHTTPITLLTARRGELEAIWGLPNTLDYDLAKEGVRLVVS